mgnify:CR=1 FL=1
MDDDSGEEDDDVVDVDIVGDDDDVGTVDERISEQKGLYCVVFTASWSMKILFSKTPERLYID